MAGKLRCVEFRIPMPLSLEEYETGVTYAYLKGIAEERRRGGQAGVALLERTAFEHDEPADPRMEAGLYRRKRNEFGQHLPMVLRGLAPEGSLAVVEQSWDCFPFKKSIFRSEYMGDAFYLEVIQMIVEDDRGELENALNLPEEYLDREIEYIDILMDEKTSSPFETPADIATFRSEEHERGPLTENFHETHDPITTVYAAVFVKLETPMLQESAEQLLISWGVRDMLAATHRHTFCLIDEFMEHDNDTLMEWEDEVLKPPAKE